jgi:small subunit ribosomal protein S15
LNKFVFIKECVTFALQKIIILKETKQQLTMQLTTESKQKLFKKFGGSEKNTGSTEAQIAMFTERINHITEHMKGQKNDFGSNRGLIRMVGKRKKLLQYLQHSNLTSYRKLIEQLGLRK